MIRKRRPIKLPIYGIVRSKELKIVFSDLAVLISLNTLKILNVLKRVVTLTTETLLNIFKMTPIHARSTILKSKQFQPL